MARASTAPVVLNLVANAECVLAGYADPILDRGISLHIDHENGNLVVLLDDRSRVACGTASVRISGMMRKFSRILWARMEGDETIQVNEITLVHGHA